MNIFNKIFNSVKTIAKKGIDLIQTKIIQPTRKRTTQIFQSISKALPKQPQQKQHTTKGKNLPTGKYSGKGEGYGDRGINNDPRTFTEQKGIERQAPKQQELIELVEEYNKEITNFREKILDNAYEVFSEEIASNIEDYMNRAINREKRRFSDNTFDDLREIDINDFLKTAEDKELQKMIDKLRENDFYDLEKRNEQYRKNWIEALYNNYGENDDTNDITQMVEEMDLDTFMLSWYNQWSDITLNDLYSTIGKEDRLDKIKEYFKDIEEKSKQ